MSDEEHDERLRVAARAADRSAVQIAQEASEAQNLFPHGLGEEVRKTGDRAKQDPATSSTAVEQKVQFCIYRILTGLGLMLVSSP